MPAIKKNEKTVSLEATGMQSMVEKYKLRVATIFDKTVWVKARAREIDLEKEMHLARDLDRVMQYFRGLYTFVGVSSNNIYWNRTPTPIRQILIPATERKYISLINPKIVKLEGQENKCAEACGSIPNKVYIVKRKPYVSISGYTLDKSYIELEYGSKDFYAGEDIIYSSYGNKEWVIQHEMDHLDGITIKDKGISLV
ncbi:MAG TPA: peptide deformylase [Syntrophales bacterium]|nr:peptide deformylase [Syntrophales bacterium]